MRSLSVIAKNLRLLVRSKGSAMVVLLAPLIIVLVIGIGFNDTSEVALNVGVHAKDTSELTQRYIRNLNTTENNIILFDDDQRCIDSVKEGTVVACIVFPPNFVLSSEKQNEVFFYADESRINLVYRLISSLTFNLDMASEEVSKELTTRMLEIMARSSDEVDTSISTIVSIKASTQSSREAASKSSGSLASLDVTEVNIDMGQFADDIQSMGADFKSIRNKGKDVAEEGYALIDELGNSSATNDFENALDKLNDTITKAKLTDKGVDDLLDAIADTEKGVNLLKTKLANTRSVKSSVLNEVSSLTSNLESMASSLDSVKTKQEAIKADIESFDITNAASIVSPITTTIESISTGKSRVTFSFPSLLMLIILFVGIMLSGTLVFMEKDSKAFFRTFTTPVKSIFFVWMTYLTSALIILLQIALIAIVVYLALDVPVFTNLQVSIAMLFLGMTVFIFLGMFIGHLFSTSEGITMSTIAISSVLIFMSNLILPIETMSPVIQDIVRFNPYVIASEGIRKAMLFNASYKDLWLDMLILAGYVLLILLAMMGAMKFSSSRLLQRMHIIAHKKIIDVPEDHYLKIDKFGLTIKDMNELLLALQSLKDQDYETIITPKNVFADWISTTFKVRSLALRMRTKHRTKAIARLEKYLEKKH